MFRKGDIIQFDFNPSEGHEPQGRRPALVVSTDYFNAGTSMTLVCPITTTNNGFPLHRRLPDGLETRGFIAIEQVRAFDLEARHARQVEQIMDQEYLSQITETLCSFF
ncbi:MAG: type II toxin-antitoxin system PemK/MazF family toxin [Coriobacteriia bacterium]|nr:type II toxin-antitoxin system PemK/MazF family toxin [Coriobacteriia bacterium]